MAAATSVKRYIFVTQEVLALRNQAETLHACVHQVRAKSISLITGGRDAQKVRLWTERDGQKKGAQQYCRSPPYFLNGTSLNIVPFEKFVSCR